ncbi:hypothetical protein OAE79_01160 [Rhodopirellula sp.]|nr:hypothetical protein [Rhodopirellula sp.]MDB4678921.1 hypothetical protein [Rhodopirellula sp.]
MMNREVIKGPSVIPLSAAKAQDPGNTKTRATPRPGQHRDASRRQPVGSWVIDDAILGKTKSSDSDFL